MSETKSPPRPLLIFFLVYFAAILPAVAWGLWTLISKNSTPVPPLSATPAGSDSARVAAMAAPLALSQGDLILAVMLSGALGSYIHSVNSFVTYVGNRSFANSWTSWYLLRPFMGVAMAVIFYVVVRSGVLVLSGGVSQVDPYAMMTVGALAGMFSKQASDKLAEVFDTLFRSRADDERGDKLPGVLKITSIDPPKATAGAQDTTFTVRGEGFVKESVVHAGGKPRATTFKSATKLTFPLAAADLAAAGAIRIEVVNPGPGGGTSAPATLTVEAAPAPAGGAAPDAALQGLKVVDKNADGSVNVISDAPKVEAGGATNPSSSDETPG